MKCIHIYSLQKNKLYQQLLVRKYIHDILLSVKRHLQSNVHDIISLFIKRQGQTTLYMCLYPLSVNKQKKSAENSVDITSSVSGGEKIHEYLHNFAFMQ